MPIPSLEKISHELATRIVSRSVKVPLASGVLFNQGQMADCLYFVKSGKATLKMQAGEKTIAIRAEQGSLLGIPAIVGNQPYSMTGEAAFDAEVFRLSRDSFDDLMQTDSRMQQAVLRILAGEVRVARQALSKLYLSSD